MARTGLPAGCRISSALRAIRTLLWNAKEVIEKIGGRYWLAARKKILDR